MSDFNKEVLINSTKYDCFRGGDIKYFNIFKSLDVVYGIIM